MATENRRYRSTESKYKGTANEMYITYDRRQKTRSGKTVTYPKVKRVYIAGDVKDSKTGTFKKKTGREVHGVKIDYEQSREGYQREGFTAKRGSTSYKVSPARVKSTTQKFSMIVEVPEKAENVHFYKNASQLPAKYKDALQDVR